MKKKTKLNFILKLEIYPVDIMFSFGESTVEAKRKVSKFVPGYNLTSLEESNLGRCTGFGGNKILIRLKNYPTTCKDYGIVAHEIFHAVTFVMDYVGIVLKLNKSDEAFTYLLGYITEKVYEKV